jgi:nitrite reductase/ring-hydroxylating ferredoxin subunit
MSSPDWHFAFASDAVPAQGMRETILKYRDIAVARAGGRLYAFGALCPHAGAPLVRHGELSACILTCTHHGWRFDLEDGGCERYGNRGLTLYSVKEEHGAIYVRV